MSQTLLEGAYNRYITKLKEQLIYFVNTEDLNDEQTASLNKVLELLKEGEEDYKKFTVATRSRHKAARKVLHLVCRELGYDCFFLCVFALSITSTIKFPVEFVGTLRAWWKDVIVPSSFGKITGKLHQQYSFATFPSKHQQGDLYAEEEPVQERSNKRLRGGEEAELHKHGSPSDDNATEDDEEDWEDEEDGRDDLEMLEEQLGSLAGVVYELEPMDAIMVLATTKVTATLTVPHRQKARPFISFYCAGKLVPRLLRHRT
ncbi:Uncharacterized protein TCAP_04426 [Tolypocladium capitatum]|uniref:Uncharacterized protein n=1 Tax=Tolypocladium capitatum TaxID=45235 RepID=A0A2K3QDM7_9HYPO|nr:Uncharacterized protein TCAP_04426 [Tolypocladium capitatum]